VLRPRGALVILWNIPLGYADLGPEVDALLDEAFERGGEPGLPRVLSGEWRAPIERGGFEALREERVEREIRRSREEWIANMLSVSSIAHQSAEAREELARGLRELIPSDAEIRNPIRTEAHWTRRA
jgi:hypothetical protein